MNLTNDISTELMKLASEIVNLTAIICLDEDYCQMSTHVKWRLAGWDLGVLVDIFCLQKYVPT